MLPIAIHNLVYLHSETRRSHEGKELYKRVLVRRVLDSELRNFGEGYEDMLVGRYT